MGECARMCFQTPMSLCISISVSINPELGAKRESAQKKKKNSHASPWTGHWNSAMQRLRVSRLEGLIIFEGHALC